MSTPVSIEAPVASRLRSDSEQERDLQARVQFMIDLQNEQQHLSDRVFKPEEISSSSQPARATTIEQPPRLPPSNRTVTNLRAMSTGGGDSEEESSFLVSKPTATPFNSTRNNSNRAVVASSLGPQQQGVGTGTLFFSNNYQSTFPASGNSNSSIDNTSDTSNNNNYQHHHGSHAGRPPLEGSGGGQMILSNVFNSQSHPQQSHHVFGGGAYGSMSTPPPPHQQHEFHYGNPDHHDPFDHPDGSNPRGRMRTSRRSTSSFLASCFCCICQPVLDGLSLQHLQRSFCYGAIDGMLTGSGIASAFCGLHVLTATATWETRLAVVAFSAAACVADSLCMALSHVWTCYVVSSGHAAERVQGRELLDTNKADAKGRLVDMLLAKGMLKIDAMSLADTLEGYPDLFVSTLVGDSLLGGADEGDMHGFHYHDSGGGASPDFCEGGANNNNGRGVPARLSSSGGGGSSTGGFGAWRFPSYAHFNNEMDHDSSEAGMVNIVMQESQMEGLVMMVSFATFATIPSLLWLILPQLVLGKHVPATMTKLSSSSTSHAFTHAMSPETEEEAAHVISLQSLVVTVIAVIMWCLGVWKSRFLDSNWVMFGIETIVVLLICVMSAYSVGSALSHFLLASSGINMADVLQPN
jgi:hypothetical protein